MRMHLALSQQLSSTPKAPGNAISRPVSSRDNGNRSEERDNKTWIFNIQACATAGVFFSAFLLLACFVPRFLSLFSIAERLVVDAVPPPPFFLPSHVHFFLCVFSCFFAVSSASVFCVVLFRLWFIWVCVRFYRYTHTHTHIHMYIYRCIYVCFCRYRFVLASVFLSF